MADPAAIETLFAAIREAVPTGQWSHGVSLARDKSVIGQSDEDDEIELRVVEARRSYEITFYPDDEEWQCSCPQGDDCRHVVAAIIALRQGLQNGTGLPKGNVRTARLGYRLGVARDKLCFRRVAIVGSSEAAEERLWTGTISGDGSHVDGAPLSVSQGDLRVERAMSSWRTGPIPRASMATLLKALDRVDDLTFGPQEHHAPATASGEAVTPIAELTDVPDGFLLKLVSDTGIERMFNNGAALVSGVLRPIASGGLSERELNELPQGKVYSADEASGLVLTILPDLERKIPLKVLTSKLPKRGNAEARLQITVNNVDDQLVVLPTLLYADPDTDQVLARVDRGRLRSMGGDLPLRSERDEWRLVRDLARSLGLAPGRSATFAGEDAVSFSQRLKTFHDAEVVGDAHEDYFLAPPMQGDVSLDADGRLSVQFSSDGRPADPSRVMKAWQRGSNLAPLDGGGWAPLPSNWLNRFGPTVVALLNAKRDDDTLPTSSFGDVLRLCDALGEAQIVPARFDHLRVLLDDFSGIPAASLPQDLEATLRDYQQVGVDWLSFLREARLGAMLADDMGLGKTLQALTAIRGRTLVVAPTSVLRNWEREAQRFRPSLTVSVYHGSKRELDDGADLILTTYAIMRLDIERLSAIQWDMAILDEAQTIKNPGSQVAQAAYRLKADFRVTLTGTPVENRLDDLWSQFNFTNPGLLGDLKTFKATVVGPIAAGDTEAAPRLRKRIRPFILRRLKSEVAKELPPRTDVVLRCVLSAQERDVYDGIRAATRKDVIEQLGGGKGSAIAALEALLRLRQASCHRGLVPGQVAKESSKVKLLIGQLEEAVAEGHKALVFSQWTGLLDRVEPHLRAAGIGFNRLDGGTRDRQGVVDAFQSPAGPPVMLLSLKAGATGLNLTAADHVFLLDPWWNPAIEDQAADRAHRIGQDRPVMVHRLVAADTVEERILDLQQSKRALADAALGDASQAGGISRDELMALLA